jgi:protein-L-isoaspartate(D-aspartate) O-methyltransferase
MIESDIQGRGITHPAVLSAMRSVPREMFVPEHMKRFAYDDSPLPIGEGQTISQPYIVAAMTEALDPEPGDIVYEVGTGSGYQAAVLAEIVSQVYSKEIVKPLAAWAQENLAAAGYTNVTVAVGDGYAGWPDYAPFDGIVVTAAPDHVPAPLIDQLKPGGRMVIPVGRQNEVQKLLLIEKEQGGSTVTRTLMPVRFVPLTGPNGEP